MRDLVRTAGDADGRRALDLRDLSDDGTDGPGRGGHGHGLALLGLTDLEQTRIRGEPGHAEHTEVGGDRSEFRIDLAQVPGRLDRVLLPTAVPEHDLTDGELGSI